MSKKFLLGCAAMIALVPLTSMISGCLKVNQDGEPIIQSSTETLGPITVIEWINPMNNETAARIYDEQTHMVCYERNNVALGCAPADYGVTDQELKTGAYIPDPYSPRFDAPEEKKSK